MTNTEYYAFLGLIREKKARKVFHVKTILAVVNAILLIVSIASVLYSTMVSTISSKALIPVSAVMFSYLVVFILEGVVASRTADLVKKLNEYRSLDLSIEEVEKKPEFKDLFE